MGGDGSAMKIKRVGGHVRTGAGVEMISGRGSRVPGPRGGVHLVWSNSAGGWGTDEEAERETGLGGQWKALGLFSK